MRSDRSDPWGAPTEWSMILGAGDDRNRGRLQASWERLVARYREPIRAAIARKVRGDAAEIADEFFAYLFQHRVLDKAAPARGRFRAYVQAVLRRFLLGRARGAKPAALLEDDVAAAGAPADARAEVEDERAWAEHVLQIALTQVAVRSPRDAEVLVRSYGIAWGGLAGSGTAQSRAEVAAALGLTPNAVDQANHRARRLLRARIEAELRETVVGAGDLDAELEVMVRRLLDAHPGLLA
jgi:RNA polymerase sigma-70 factor (ECF subfamily)